MIYHWDYSLLLKNHSEFQVFLVGSNVLTAPTFVFQQASLDHVSPEWIHPVLVRDLSFLDNYGEDISAKQTCNISLLEREVENMTNSAFFFSRSSYFIWSITNFRFKWSSLKRCYKWLGFMWMRWMFKFNLIRIITFFLFRKH